MQTEGSWERRRASNQIKDLLQTDIKSNVYKRYCIFIEPLVKDYEIPINLNMLVRCVHTWLLVEEYLQCVFCASQDRDRVREKIIANSIGLVC